MNESSELAKALDALVKTSKEGRSVRLAHEMPTPLPYAPGYTLRDTPREEKPLRDYWQAVRKHLSLIIGLTAVITTLAIIFVSRKPNEYDAVALVQIDLENPNSGLGAAKNGAVVLSNPNDPAYFNTQLQILDRAGLLRRVVKTLDLDHNPGFLQSDTRKVSTWQNLLQMVGISAKPPEPGKAEKRDEFPLLNGSVAPAMSRADLDEAIRLDPYVTAIQRNLKVVPIKEERLPIKDTRLIEITFNHNNPKIAAKVVNTIVDTFVLSNLEKKVEVNATAG
jgi:succinoglycan biosynthesis transport protein ExoP